MKKSGIIALGLLALGSVSAFAAEEPAKVLYYLNGQSISIAVQSDGSYRKTRKSMSLHVHCKECPWDSVADGLPREPPWVEKLGPRIQTSVTVLDGHRAGNKRAVPQTKGAADDLLALRTAKRSERKKKSIPLAKVKRGLGLR